MTAIADEPSRRAKTAWGLTYPLPMTIGDFVCSRVKPKSPHAGETMTTSALNISQNYLRRLSRRFSRVVDRYQPSEATLLIITAIAIGIVTGLAAVVFIRLIDLVTRLSFGGLPGWMPALGRGWLIVIPVLGGLVGGPIIAFFASEAKGHGVPEVMQALVLEGGRIRPRVALAKIAASSICIGTGGSAGREGPIVQVGSTFGSVTGQLLRLSEARIRNLVACGAAAGIAATFNAPIAGVAFAIEVLVGDLSVSLLSNVVIAAVTASVISQIFLGSDPAFLVPTYGLNSPLELFLYAILGFLTAYVGIAFIRVLYKAEDLFDGWKRMPMWAKPAVGALLLGVLGFAYPPVLARLGLAPDLAGLGWPLFPHNIPHVFGGGFPTIEASLRGPLPLLLLGSLVVLKMLATAFTLGSGNSGGVFAPSLFMGAMLGGFFGVVMNMLFPTIAVHPGAYALAGMAGVFVGAARAPLTAMLIAFEMSNDYKVILPLMVVTIISVWVAHRRYPESIYTLKLVRRGLRLRYGRDVDILDAVRVREIMDTDPPTVPETISLQELQEYFDRTHHHGTLVLDKEGRLVGIITLQDLARSKKRENWETLPVSACMTRTLVTARPDESIGDALQRIAARDIGRIPVVASDDPQKLLGILRRQDIIRAYRLGIVHRKLEADRVTQWRASKTAGVEFLELQVQEGAPVANKRVAELELPPGVLLTTIRHDTERHLLHGDDVLNVGDVVLALAEPEHAAELRRLFSRPEPRPQD
ncbi:MAG: CBS domain-containing protein [Caldilineae bacterium]|nr:MAG: CBS domain-containing protein [Caldilineae bacterium]